MGLTDGFDQVMIADEVQQQLICQSVESRACGTNTAQQSYYLSWQSTSCNP